LNYSVNICSDYTKVCPNPAGYLPKGVVTGERIIFANLTYKPATPVKIALFFWER